MSKLSQVHAKPVGEPVALPCIGYCCGDYQAALARMDSSRPDWTRVRRNQRAWVEMFKRTEAHQETKAEAVLFDGTAPGGDLQVRNAHQA